MVALTHLSVSLQLHCLSCYKVVITYCHVMLDGIYRCSVTENCKTYVWFFRNNKTLDNSLLMRTFYK